MLIVGCGAVGQQIAEAALQRGVSVNCLVRTEESARRLRESGLDARALDLDRQIAAPLEATGKAQVFYLAPPPPDGRQDPRIQHFLAALPEGSKPRIVYISTTGVYGDCKGAWVDERRPANPQVDRARRRRDAELQLLRWREAVGGEVIILRVAGIYGPGKLPLERLAKQTPMVGEREAPWTNRIHITDLVSVCEAAMALGNVVGSNLFNSLVVLPAGGLIDPIVIPNGGLSDLVFSWLLTAALIPIFIFGKARLGRGTGSLLLGAYLIYAGLRAKDRRELAREKLELVGLKDRMDHKPPEL